MVRHALLLVVIFPIEDVAAALLRATAHDLKPHVFECPRAAVFGGLSMYEEPFFNHLFPVLAHGNDHLKGATKTLLRPELQCLYRVMLEKTCGDLPSRSQERLEAWQTTCLDPSKKVEDTIALMSAQEQAYAHKVEVETANNMTARIWSDPQDRKAFLCMQMKVVDDGCLNRAVPQLFVSGQDQNPTKEVQSIKHTARESRPGLTNAATKDEVEKLVSSELDEVRHFREVE